MKRLIVWLGAAMVVASGVVLGSAAVAGACSIAGPEPIADVVTTGRTSWGAPVVGVYEQQHIARRPDLWFTSPRSVTKIVRYWGVPPALSLQRHGEGFLLIGECGDSASPVGRLNYGWVGEDTGRRASFSTLDISTGDTYRPKLPAEWEVLLTEAYGPPTVRDVSLTDRVTAQIMLWWPPLLTAFIFAGAVFAISRRVRRLREGGRIEPDLRVVFAGAVGTLGVALLVPSFDVNDWFGLLAAFIVAAAVALLSPTLVALAAVGVLVNGVATTVLGDPTATGVGDGRLQAGLGCMLIGAGALVFTRRHWSRLPAAAAVVSGSGLFASNLLGVRGVTGEVWVGIGTAAAMAIVAAAVWWLSPGAEGVEPRHDDETASAVLN